MADYKEVDKLNKRIKSLYEAFGKSNNTYKYMEAYITAQARQYGFKTVKNKKSGFIQLSKGKKSIENINEEIIDKMLSLETTSEKIKKEMSNEGLTKQEAIESIKRYDTVKGFINSHLGEIYKDTGLHALVKTKNKKNLSEDDFLKIVQSVGEPHDIDYYMEIFDDEGEVN